MRSLGTLLIARLKEEKFDLYGKHLLYLDVKRHYTGVVEPKACLEELFGGSRNKVADKNIIPGLIKRLGGGKE